MNSRIQLAAMCSARRCGARFVELWLCLAMFMLFVDLTPAMCAQPSEEEQLIGILKSDAGPLEKDKACVRLKQIGTTQSVPALAALLSDHDLSHSARHALESMPAPEAGAALVAALDRTTSMTLAGVIQSVGIRGEVEAVAALTGRLKSPEPVIASAAAEALGKIDSMQAVWALKGALDGSKGLVHRAIADAILAAASRMPAQGNGQTAYSICKLLFRKNEPDYVRTAAYLGMIRAADGRALSLVTKALRGQDGAAQRAALQAIPNVKDEKATLKLSRMLTKFSPPLQMAMIDALSQRGDPAAASDLIATVKSSPDEAVRVHAIHALGILGDSLAVASLAEAAVSNVDAEQKAAREALTDLNRGDVTGALLDQLALGPPKVHGEVARALIGRGDRGAVAGLIALAQGSSSSARKAACQALGQLADAGQLSALAGLVAQAEGESARGQAQQALASLCSRLREGGEPVDITPVIDGISAGSPEVQASLLQASSALADARLRTAFREAIASTDEPLRAAATRALTETRDPGMLPDLLAIAREGGEPSLRVLAARGYIRLALDPDDAPLSTSERVNAMKEILPDLQRADEKWLVLSGLAGLADPEALQLALSMLGDEATRAEAAQAVVKIADSLVDSHPETAREAIKKALAVSTDPNLQEHAQEVLRRIDEHQAAVQSSKPFKSSPTPIRFVRQQLDAAFRSEGVAVADFNHDGALDIATGNVLYFGPDWKAGPMQESVRQYDPDNYSNEFLCFAEDIDRDGWVDLIVVGFPGAKTRWMKNPGEAGGPWRECVAIEQTGNESPDWLDVDGDGRKELLFMADKGLAIARPGTDPTQMWTIRVLAGPDDPRPGHGLGVGDMNGDGRADVVCPEGWWEAPNDAKTLPWKFHKAALSDSPAQMIVDDVDGDGDADVLSSSAHGYGFWWYEQNGPNWVKHDIDSSISEMHALHLADVNGDGSPDIVSGKRFWAHRHESGTEEPAVLRWYELTHKDGAVSWVRHDIDLDSGVGLHIQIVDVNGDGRLDIVTSNKKGVYVFTQQAAQ